MVKSKNQNGVNVVRKSYGKMRGTRKKLKLRKKLAISAYLKEFNAGDKVSIIISTGKNIQSPKFQGLTGTVVGRRGNSYEVKIRDKNAEKTLFIKPEHLSICR
jgi:large subunit ribosomal protein L21e